MLVGVSPPLGPRLSARRGGGVAQITECDAHAYRAAAPKHNVGAALTQQLQLKKGGAQTRTDLAFGAA